MPRLKIFKPYESKKIPLRRPAHRLSSLQIAKGIQEKKSYLAAGTITQLQLQSLASKFLKEHRELEAANAIISSHRMYTHRNEQLQGYVTELRAQLHNYATRNRKYILQNEYLRAENKSLRKTAHFGQVNEAEIIRNTLKVRDRQIKRGTYEKGAEEFDKPVR